MSFSPNPTRRLTAMDTARPGGSHTPILPHYRALYDAALKDRDLERERNDSVADQNPYRGDRPDPTVGRVPFEAEDVSGASDRETERPNPLSPPGSRRTSGDESKDTLHPPKYYKYPSADDSPSVPRPPFADDRDQRQTPRQSLPSIHEALGDTRTGLPPLTSSEIYSRAYATAPPQHAAQQIQSPPDSGRRQYAPEPPTPGNMNGYPPQKREPSPYSARSAAVPPPVLPTSSSTDGYASSYSSEYRRASGNSATIPASSSDGYTSCPPDYQRHSATQPPVSRLPSLHPIQTGAPSVDGTHPHSYPGYAPQQSPAYEHPPQPAPPSSVNASYPPYPQHQYPNSAPPTGPPAGPFAHQAMAPPGHPPAHLGPGYPSGWNARLDGADLNRVEESKRAGRPAGSTYGRHVKRKLESFGYETSLNEIHKNSGDLQNFSSRHGNLAHQAQKTGLGIADLPEPHHVDDQISKCRQTLAALERVKEFVMAENIATNHVSQDPRYALPNGYSEHGERDSVYGDDRAGADKNGGFAVPDTKKRRGRAAPPGRCHSCNRAETPEWRRGPDGARTLCNACGLHYAKLTRKVGAAGAARAGTSEIRKGYGPSEILEKIREQNLQPKESPGTSPTASMPTSA